VPVFIVFFFFRSSYHNSCCGAGVAADAEVTTQMMSSNVELHSLSTGRPPLVAMVTRQLKQMLFR